jgi:hypothetical protein
VSPRTHCGINDALGGGIFVCRRPLSPEGNGSFCAYHGGWPHNGSKLELTWREWFRVQFIRRPRNVVWRLREIYRRFRLMWHIRKHPKCKIPKCSEKALSPKGGKCIDHCYGDFK